MDSEFGSLLLRAISIKLDGDQRNVVGLRDAVLKCASFELYRETCGRISAFMEVISMMEDIAKKINRE